MGNNLQKYIGYLTTPIYVVVFVSILVLFHPFLVIGRKISERLFQKTLVLMNRAILRNLSVTAGVTFEIDKMPDLPKDRPIIIVSNHQSMYDVPLLIVSFRDYFPRFISKQELGRWIPSISFSLRNMGSLQIDRGDQRGALKLIKDYAAEVSKNNWAVSIFPEGTRARDGVVKKFKPLGMITLIENVPNALIVPVVIDGMWEVLRYNFWPVPFGVKVTYKVLNPIESKSEPPERLIERIEQVIRDEMARIRSETLTTADDPVEYSTHS